jgi:glycosyltransferase involved in cell wall biosynthesis
MSMNELPQMRQADTRGSVCIVIAAPEGERLDECLESLRRHTQASVPLLRVAPSSAAVNEALEQVAPADVLLLCEPCRVGPGWLERMADAARADTNTATVSALADAGGELALSDGDHPPEDFAEIADRLSEHTLRLRPRLSRAVGPCVFLRRDALELLGSLDLRLELRPALEVDFTQRCVASGLTHVAADDVVVGRLAPAERTDEKGAHSTGAEELPAILVERYPYLSAASALADSAVLTRALEAARGPRERLSVTLDARALDASITGTQVNILELILALAHTEALRLRVLVHAERIDGETLELLERLPDTEVLAAEGLDPATPRSAVFHRPQQTFSPGDVALALTLGERFVLSQLDLIAYRNPAYFIDFDAWEDYRRASRFGLAAAERVVVFSDHTLRELLSDGLVSEERIRIVPPGLDHRTSAEPQRPAALDDGRDPPLAAGFMLCLGTDFLHKNRIFALRLLAALREHHDWEGTLVLAGTHIAHGSSLELERSFLDEHAELREDVVTLGPVSEKEKAWLIAHAGAVLYPSVYEGFGLVPFESALQGVPCVFAPQSSLAEAAPEGTATILRWDPEASAAAVQVLLTDGSARERHVHALAEAGRAMTWASAAGAMVEIYREAAIAPVRDAATLSRDTAQRESRLSFVDQAAARRLLGEREHAQRMYNELNAEVGFGLGLIGPHGSLPESLQRALLALSARPGLSRPLFGALSGAFIAARSASRTLRGRFRRAR